MPNASETLPAARGHDPVRRPRGADPEGARRGRGGSACQPARRPARACTRPTVHGLLQTLQAHGFVEQDRDSDKYQLGAGPAAPRQLLPRPQRAARALARARRAARHASAGDAVRVGVLHGASVVVVHHVFRPDAAFQVLEVGAQLPAHASALGKAMLAYAPEPVARRPDRRAAAASSPAHAHRGGAARRSSRRCARRGLARERDEAVLGESSVAAPIHDHAGHAVGAIGVVGDTERILPRGPARGPGPGGHRGGAQRLARARRRPLDRRLIAAFTLKVSPYEPLMEAMARRALHPVCATSAASR